MKEPYNGLFVNVSAMAKSASDIYIDNNWNNPCTVSCSEGDIIILNHDGGTPSYINGATYLGRFNSDNLAYRATSSSVTVGWGSGFMDIGIIKF